MTDARRWTPEEDQQLIEAADNPRLSMADIQSIHFPHRSYDSVRNRFRRLLETGLADERPEPDKESEDKGSNEKYTWSQSGNSAFCSFVTDKPISTEDELLDAGNIDREKWKVDKFKIGSWTTPMKSLGDQGVIQNIRVSADLSKRKKSENYAKIRDEMIEAITQHTPEYWAPDVRDEGPVLFEISPFDLHLGKRGWRDEVGTEYNSQVADDRLRRAIDILLQRATGSFDIDRILLPLGNDFFHYDNLAQSTTNGTVQDADEMWQENFQHGRRLMVDAIDILSSVAPVDVLIVPGNHDRQRAFYLGEALYCWYYNVPHVTVDNGPSMRKYYKWGTNLLGFTHGNHEKHNSLPHLMSNECKKWWADSEVREWHLGHIHQKREVKYNAGDTYDGTTVRTLPSLSGTDSWHHRMGYVKNTKACQAFLWDADEGRVGFFETRAKEE